MVWFQGDRLVIARVRPRSMRALLEYAYSEPRC